MIIFIGVRFMFYASQHQLLNLQHNVNDIAVFERNLPNKMILHSTFVYIEEGYFQCLWEADTIDMVQQYISTTVGDECQSDYYNVDPMTTIA